MLCLPREIRTTRNVVVLPSTRYHVLPSFFFFPYLTLLRWKPPGYYSILSHLKLTTRANGIPQNSCMERRGLCISAIRWRSSLSLWSYSQNFLSNSHVLFIYVRHTLFGHHSNLKFPYFLKAIRVFDIGLHSFVEESLSGNDSGEDLDVPKN